MKITAQRGAIAITLDRPRILFFPMDATWLLVQRYGVGFLAELYTIEKRKGAPKLTLKSLDALKFFLWAGLQAEISGTGEVLDEDAVAEFFHPWTLNTIFNAVVMAVTGAASTPKIADSPGKAEAGGARKSPSAVAKVKRSTSTKGRGSSAEA